MVNLAEKTLEVRGQTGKLIGFETWWMTPRGLVADLDEALRVVGELGVPDICLKPVTVAIADNGVYEPMI